MSSGPFDDGPRLPTRCPTCGRSGAVLDGDEPPCIDRWHMRRFEQLHQKGDYGVSAQDKAWSMRMCTGIPYDPGMARCGQRTPHVPHPCRRTRHDVYAEIVTRLGDQAVRYDVLGIVYEYVGDYGAGAPVAWMPEPEFAALAADYEISTRG